MAPTCGQCGARMQLDQFDRGRLSQTEDVYGQLRGALLSGRYLPDQKLKISELCGEVQGSLGAVREALSRLLAEGLVVSESYKGYSVAPVSRTDLISLTNARIEIERLCLASSLANGDLEWEGRLVALLHQMNRHSPLEDAANTIEDWSRLHTAFHDALVSACDNPWLLRMHRTLHEQSERYRRFVLKLNAGLEESSRRQVARDTTTEHRDLLDAALARDIDRMNTLMAAHLQRTTQLLLTALETDEIALPVESISVQSRPSRAS
jgi:GntR family carbon starvation induced transcriptional regulator